MDFPTSSGSWLLETEKNYIVLAFLMLMVYDHLLTFDKEVEWIWTLKWRLPKFLFLINNYAISPLIILTCIAYTIDDNNSPYVWNITGLLTPW